MATKGLYWYEKLIFAFFGRMLKSRGYKYFDGIGDKDGITALVFSTVEIKREYPKSQEAD